MSDATAENVKVVKVHLGFAPSRVSAAKPGRMVAFAIDEKRRYWGWFNMSTTSGVYNSPGSLRIVQDGDEVPAGWRYVGSEFETTDDGGLHGYHAYAQW